jgi:hypothetical protein
LSIVIAERRRFGLLLQPVLASDAKTCRGYFFVFGVVTAQDGAYEVIGRRYLRARRFRRAGVAGFALKGYGMIR